MRAPLRVEADRGGLGHVADAVDDSPTSGSGRQFDVLEGDQLVGDGDRDEAAGRRARRGRSARTRRGRRAAGASASARRRARTARQREVLRVGDHGRDVAGSAPLELGEQVGVEVERGDLVARRARGRARRGPVPAPTSRTGPASRAASARQTGRSST